MILRQEGGEDGLPVDCCPTVLEMVEPVGGRNRDDMYVQLYRDGPNAQRFFEYSCRPDVLDKPCRFIDRKFSNQSRCVQKFSYTYAIIENSGSKVSMENRPELFIGRPAPRSFRLSRQFVSSDPFPRYFGRRYRRLGTIRPSLLIRSDT